MSFLTVCQRLPVLRNPPPPSKPLVKKESTKEKSLAGLYAIAFACRPPSPRQTGDLPDVNPPESQPAAFLPTEEQTTASPPSEELPNQDHPARGQELPPGPSRMIDVNLSHPVNSTVVQTRVSYSDWSEDEDDDGGLPPSIPPVIARGRATGEVESTAPKDKAGTEELDNAFCENMESPGGTHSLAIVTPTTHPTAPTIPSPFSDPDDISPLLLSPSQRPDFNQTRVKTVTGDKDATVPGPHYRNVRRRILMPPNLVIFNADDRQDTGEVNLDETSLARTLTQPPGVSPVNNTFLLPTATAPATGIAAGVNHSRRHSKNDGDDYYLQSSAATGPSANAERPHFNPSRDRKGRFTKSKR